MKADAVVIGSGISGLTTAAILAKKGKRVVIIEKNRKPGGALKRFVRQGIPFDVGFHYTGCLGDREILKILWDYLKILPALTVKPFPADGYDRIEINGTAKHVRCFFSYELFEEELNRIFPSENKCISTYLGTLRTICEGIPFFNLQDPITPFLRGFWGQSARTGLVDFLASMTKNADLQAVLTAPAFLYGVAPRMTSLATHAMVAHAFYSGAYAVDGGGQAIVDAFLPVLKGSGIEIKVGCQATGISIKGARVAGVVTEQGEISAADVIYTGHPTYLLNLLPEGIFRPVYASRLKELQNTCSMFIVFGTVENSQLSDELTWTNRYSIPTGFDVLTVDRQNPEAGSLMLTAPGLRDTDSTATSTAKGAILMRPADWSEVKEFCGTKKGSRSPAYSEWKAEATTRILARAERIWGESARITPIASGSPLTFRDELSAPEGAVYGVSHSMNQFITGARTKVPGLWLSGQGTLMTGIVGASLSGMVTAGEILGLEDVWDEVRQCH